MHAGNTGAAPGIQLAQTIDMAVCSDCVLKLGAGRCKVAPVESILIRKTRIVRSGKTNRPVVLADKMDVGKPRNPVAYRLHMLAENVQPEAFLSLL